MYSRLAETLKHLRQHRFFELECLPSALMRSTNCSEALLVVVQMTE